MKDNGQYMDQLDNPSPNTLLLATRFSIPRPRTSFVPRPRLTMKLDQATSHKLTLISAPAGSGKTTLLSEWIASHHSSPVGPPLGVAWLYLFRKEQYLIRLKGYLEPRQLSPLFSDFSVEREDGETRLSGSVPDQVTLYTLLDTIRDPGLPLLSVARVEPNLEEVFIHLIEREEEHYENSVTGSL